MQKTYNLMKNSLALLCILATGWLLPTASQADAPVPTPIQGKGYHLVKNWDFSRTVTTKAQLADQFYTRYVYNNGTLDGPYCNDQSIVCTDAVANAPSGTQLPITPKWKLNGTARYEWALDSDFHAHVQGSFIHSSGTWSDLRIAERTLLGKNNAYTMFDFTTGIDKDNWALELYIKNAFDERAQLGRYAECTPGTCGFEPYILPSQPRTIGLTWSQKF